MTDSSAPFGLTLHPQRRRIPLTDNFRAWLEARRVRVPDGSASATGTVRAAQRRPLSPMGEATPFRQAMLAALDAESEAAVDAGQTRLQGEE